MQMNAEEPLGEDQLAEILGEPLMVGDPLITVRQASVVLGVSDRQVTRMIMAGHLPDHGPYPHSHRRLLLSEVMRARGTEWLTIAAAAEILDVYPAVVRRLITVRLLPNHGKPLPFTRAEVVQFADLRSGWVSIGKAAVHLEVEPEEIHWMLRERVLRHTGDVSRPVELRQLRELAAETGPGSAAETG